LLANLVTDDEENTPARRRATPRPTFTPTPDYTDTPTVTSTPTITPIPTETPTPIPTNTPLPTDTPTPTNTPEPTRRPPPPPPAPPTNTPAPVPTPTPDFPFTISEQGNREFQKTNHPAIVVYVAITDANNVPVGGLKVVGDHSSGQHVESAQSDWRWSVVNCLDCSYAKQGNLKFEPGSFIDGTWNIYLADSNGTQLSKVVPLAYSADPAQWVWDFIIFKKK
jgi:hypothetical protein